MRLFKRKCGSRETEVYNLIALLTTEQKDNTILAVTNHPISMKKNAQGTGMVDETVPT